MEDQTIEMEPQVINREIIKKCIYDQAEPGEVRRLLREESVPLEEVVELRLEFLKILRMDHLWMLVSMTKLSLSNNLIERIENLDTLVNIIELDLSFNKITKIENLNTLVNLEILSLFENNISKLENIDNLKKLIIFSIGRNWITDRDNVLELRQFPCLKSVNMAGNPCAQDKGFLVYVCTFLPQITYYQYRLINEDDRALGLEIYSEELCQVEMEENKQKEIQDKIEADIAEAELNACSFVEFLGSSYLFDYMFDVDQDGKALVLVNPAVQRAYSEFESHFIVVTKQIFNMGQEQYKIRQAEIEEFREFITAGKEKNQLSSTAYMEEFLIDKAEIFLIVKKMEEQLSKEKITVEECNINLQSYSDEFNDILHEVWKELMELELTLFDQMEEIIQTFEQNMIELVNIFIEGAQGGFTELRELEQTFCEILGNEANEFQTLAMLQDGIYIPEELQVIMSDKDILVNALGTSHESHLLTIDKREDTLVNKSRGWVAELISQFQREEIERNRAKILEINHFLDIQREEFEELQSFTQKNPLEIDINAALQDPL